MNSDDKKLFLDNEIASITQAEMIPGSGIDIEKFKQSGKHKSTTSFTFLLFSRMIWDKGIGEYIKAAEIILKRYANVKFQLLGFLNCDNPYPVKKRQIGKWEQDGIIEYLGEAENVIPYIDKADCVVLPTYYREGIPKCLLEAMSMEKPVISTDVPGCRDLIEDGIDGFLCRPRDAIDLADKMQSMMDLPDEKRKEMGKNGREKIVNNYSDDTVFKKYLRFIEDITGI